GNFYGIFDSHKIFEKFDDLRVTPQFFHGPYFCQRCDEITTDKTCGCADKYKQEISGTYIRKQLLAKKPISPKIFRPEVLKTLLKLNDLFVETT
ncbi:MAG: sulfate adenylyltransferase, partial [Candidatus Omnitrophica bacterium]|nr:sulfate adenylyltransferase [Candidatus Omnitrophota bacterium]